jgi:hypothetical protein
MLSAETDGLFQRAIMQSAPLGVRTGREAMTMAQRRVITDALGPAPHEATVEQMLSAQAAAIQAAAPFGTVSGLPFAPILGHPPGPIRSRSITRPTILVKPTRWLVWPAEPATHVPSYSTSVDATSIPGGHAHWLRTCWTPEIPTMASAQVSDRRERPMSGPPARRAMADQAGAAVCEVAAGRSLHVSPLRATADVIKQAAVRVQRRACLSG